MKMRSVETTSVLLFVSLLGACNANFIIPEELQSILSIVYSNIPQVRKGTDSRVGLGFRFGDHADFQVQFEVGPQLFTATKYGESFQSATGTGSKRDATEEAYLKSTSKKQQKKDWLQSWSRDAQNQQKQQYLDDPMPVVMKKPVISESALKQLVQLYGKPQNDVPKAVGTKAGAEQAGDFKNLPDQVLAAAQPVTQRTKEQNDRITADLSDVDLD